METMISDYQMESGQDQQEIKRLKEENEVNELKFKKSETEKKTA